MADEAIQATNDDASECKKSAVQCGYWQDNFIGYFVKQICRKTPEINRGYYVRVRSIELLLEQFLKVAGDTGQVLNLGAGFDTLYWRSKDAGKRPSNFVEIDFPNVSAKKCQLIQKYKPLLDLLSTAGEEVKIRGTDLHAANYHLVGADLRNVAGLESKLREAMVDTSQPTLFLAECVLVYMDCEATANLLKYLARVFPNSIFISYEQVNMKDKFGQVMLENLRQRGCLLPGARDCESLESQRKRFLSSGWGGVDTWIMTDVYNALPERDRSRIECIEMFDEMELLTQLLQHYCLSIAWNGHMFRSSAISPNFLDM